RSHSRIERARRGEGIQREVKGASKGKSASQIGLGRPNSARVGPFPTFFAAALPTLCHTLWSAFFSESALWRAENDKIGGIGILCASQEFGGTRLAKRSFGRPRRRAMKRIMILSAALALWLAATSSSDAQVFIRAPFVRVAVGDGVSVRAPFVR